MFAKALGAELVLPPAVHRTAFNATARWRMAPASSLLDLKFITEYWSGRGVIIHTVTSFVPYRIASEVSKEHAWLFSGFLQSQDLFTVA